MKPYSTRWSAGMALVASMASGVGRSLGVGVGIGVGVGVGILAAVGVAHAAPGLPSNNVNWLPAAADADIDQAFARARAQRKPVLLYWGATWCPPCNQLKATLFNRQDFAAQAKSFVAVHVDGDRPGAQKLGARFKVGGYPTVILMAADGSEITRLPGAADAEQIMQVLRLGMSGGRPMKSVLADAQSGKALSSDEWRLLAFYGWEIDESRLVPQAQRAAVLTELAVKSPAGDGETSTRLWLKAIAASDDGQGLKPDAGVRARVQRVLLDPAQARSQMDVLIGGAPAMVKLLSAEDSPDRMALVAQFDTTLARLQADITLSHGDRIDALVTRVELARIEQPKDAVQPRINEPLLREVRDTAGRMDREITDGYERQAVITSAAWMLARAGLWADSDGLLKGNLARSHSPYYLMSQLGGNARRQGRTDEALRWHQQAFERSEGPATRLQWGSGYLAALVDLAPDDAPRIEKTAALLLREAIADKSGFHDRSARSMQRVTNKLLAWNTTPQRDAVVKRLVGQRDNACRRVAGADGQRAACLAMFLPAKLPAT